MTHTLDVVARIDAWAERGGARLAHVSGQHTMSFAQLRDRSDRLAHALTQRLPDDRSPIAVLGHKEPEMLIGFLGCLKAGHPYVPLDDALPPRRVDEIVAVCGSRLTLTPTRVRELVAQSDGRARGRPLESEDVFYVIFTSGSTGVPKGVPITVACLADFFAWMEDEQRFRDDEVFLNQVPYSFDVSILDTYLGLLNGGTVFAVSRDLIANPARLFAALPDSGISIWTSTPAFVRMCLAERRFQQSLLPRLRKFFLAGEALLRSTVEQLLDRFPDAEVWNMYGPTEATVVVTSVRLNRTTLDAFPTVPIGVPKPRTRIDVVGADDAPVPSGEQGEIVIAGPTVSPGYLNPPSSARPAFFTSGGMRAYRTGDLGHYQDGLLFFDGRRDDQIKLHGNRIELGDVEVHLTALPPVREAVVLPMVKDGQVESLRAFVVLRERSSRADFEIEQELRRGLAGALPAHMVPRRIQILDAMPMNLNGKIDRRALSAGGDRSVGR